MDSVRGITKLLYALVNLLKLYLRRICRRDDLRHCLFHGFALADEALERVVAFLADVTPVSVWFTIEVFIFVDEIHSSLEFVRRGHELFRLERGDVLDVKAHDPVGALFWSGS